MTDSNGGIGLHYYVHKNDLPGLLGEIQLGVNLERRVAGMTALASAVVLGRLELVRALAAAGADVEAAFDPCEEDPEADCSPIRPVEIALYERNWLLVELLIRLGAEPPSELEQAFKESAERN